MSALPWPILTRGDVRNPFDVCRLRVWAVGLVAALVCGWISDGAAQRAIDKQDRDIHSIRADGTLRVAITRFDLPAFHYRRIDKSTVGPEIDLAKQIASALQVNMVLVDDPPSFDAVVEGVADGRADIGISKLSQTYYRLMIVRFSQPYLTLRHGLLFDRARIAQAAAGGPPEEVLRNFRGSIGVIGGSAYADFARRNFSAARLVELANWTDVVDALKAGRIDAIYRDEFEIKLLLKSNPALNIKFGAAILTDQFAFLSIAICNSCSKLQEFINYHLTQTRGAFTLERLLSSE